VRGQNSASPIDLAGRR